MTFGTGDGSRRYKQHRPTVADQMVSRA